MQFWKMSPMCRPTADSQWGVSGIHSLSLRRHVIRSPRPYKLYLNLISVCDCVTDETQCLPWEDRSLENDVHSFWVLSGLQFSRRELFWQFLLRGPLSENNHPWCVCQLFEKFTTISNWTYYSHLRLLHQLYKKTKQNSHDCISLCVSRDVWYHQADLNLAPPSY